MAVRRPINLGQRMTTIGAPMPLGQMPAPKPKAEPPGYMGNPRAEALAAALADGDLMRPTGSGTIAEALARGGEAFLRTRGALAGAEREENRYAQALAREQEATNREVAGEKDERDYRERALAAEQQQFGQRMAQDQTQFDQSLALQREQFGQRLGVDRMNAQTSRLNAQRTQTANSPLTRQLATQDARRVTQYQSVADRDAATAQRLQRFRSLNTQEPGTGPGSYGTWAPLGIGRNSQTQEMMSIASDLTPEQREPGSGATSDFDARMFQQALPGIDKAPEVNEAITQAYQRRSVMTAQRAEEARAWLELNGTLNGFDRAWRQYVEANPIFDPSSADAPQINERWMSIDEWMANGAPGLTRESSSSATEGMSNEELARAAGVALPSQLPPRRTNPQSRGIVGH